MTAHIPPSDAPKEPVVPPSGKTDHHHKSKQSKHAKVAKNTFLEANPQPEKLLKSHAKRVKEIDIETASTDSSVKWSDQNAAQTKTEQSDKKAKEEAQTSTLGNEEFLQQVSEAMRKGQVETARKLWPESSQRYEAALEAKRKADKDLKDAVGDPKVTAKFSETELKALFEGQRKASDDLGNVFEGYSALAQFLQTQGQDDLLQEVHDAMRHNKLEKAVALWPELSQRYHTAKVAKEKAEDLLRAAQHDLDDFDIMEKPTPEMLRDLEARKKEAAESYHAVEKLYKALKKQLAAVMEFYPVELSNLWKELEARTKSDAEILKNIGPLSAGLRKMKATLEAFHKLCVQHNQSLSHFYIYQSLMDQIQAKVIGATLNEATAKENTEGMVEGLNGAVELMDGVATRMVDLANERSSWIEMREDVVVSRHLKPGHSKTNETLTDVNDKIQATAFSKTFVDEAQTALTTNLRPLCNNARLALTTMSPNEAFILNCLWQSKFDKIQAKEFAAGLIDATANKNQVGMREHMGYSSKLIISLGQMKDKLIEMQAKMGSSDNLTSALSAVDEALKEAVSLLKPLTEKALKVLEEQAEKLRAKTTAVDTAAKPIKPKESEQNK